MLYTLPIKQMDLRNQLNQINIFCFGQEIRKFTACKLTEICI